MRKPRTTTRVAGVLTALAVLLIAGAQLSAAAGFQVVVNSSNPTTTLSATEASRIFLKKTSTWSHGAHAQPVDQGVGSAAREAFSQEVLKKGVSAVESFWQQQIFSGRGVPPPKLSSDAQVLDYIKGNPGAIGYVSEGASTAGVKTVEVTP